MKRRNFIQQLSSSFILPVMIDGYGAKAFSRTTPFMQALMDVADNNDRVLVIIQLNGGNDGLNMVLPLDQMSTYQSIRSNIAIPEAKVLKLNGNATTGLHPAMTGLQAMYNEGKLSIVQAVSYPNPNFSHFRSSDIWMTGSDSNQTLTTGWAGRYLDNRFPNYPDDYPNANMPDPIAIQIGYTTSTALLGPAQNMAVAIPDPDTFAQLVGDKPFVAPGDLPNTYAGKQVAFIREQQVSSVQYAAQIKTSAAKGKNIATYPTGNSLADQLKIVARLIQGGLQTKVYYVNLGGFDTHANQVELTDTTTGEHADLMADISMAVKSFQDDLKAMSIEDKVIGMTFSEFGRRAISNGSRGTDHGLAAPLFVFGTGVKTQMVGTNPNLKDLDGNNLKMQHDFRQVYAAILEDWFGSNAATETAVLFKDYQSVPVFRQTITAVEPTFTAKSFKIYPNPASSDAIVESESFVNGIGTFQLTDITGRTFNIPRTRLSPVQLKVDVSELPVGRYFLNIETEKEYLRGALMVQR